MNTALLLHILDRGIIHFAASTFVFVASYFFLSWLSRKHGTLHLYLVPAVFVFAFTAPREAFDVAAGQPLIKAVTDYISWILGAAASAYGVYRLRKIRT